MMKEYIPSRRAMLRGVFAVGCGLLVPSVLLGCSSKNEATSGNAAPDSPPAAAPDVAAPAVAKKVPQASVQYQPQPKGDRKCSGCLHFIPDSNTCELVDGQISPEGWCVLWTQKT